MILPKCQLALILTFSTFACLHPSVADAQNEKWNTEFVPDDAFVVVALDVESIVRLVDPKSEMYTMISGELEEEAGIKLSEIKQFQFIMGGEKEEIEAEDYDDEDALEIKLLFNKDQNFDELALRMFRRGNHEKVKRDGVEYYRSGNESNPSFFAPDTRTLVVANEPRLIKLIDSPKTMGNFVDRLSRADRNAEIYFAFTQHELIHSQFLSEMPSEPIDVQDIGGEATSGELSIDLESDRPILGQIIAKDAEGANRLKRAIDALIGMGKFALPQGKKEVENDETLPREMRKKALESIALAQAILDGATIATTEKKLNIEFKVKGGIKGSMEALSLFFLSAGASAEAVPVVEPDLTEESKPEEIEKKSNE